MRIEEVVHGTFPAALREPGGEQRLDVPDGVDIKRIVEILSARSPLFDPRACLAVVDGTEGIS